MTEELMKLRFMAEDGSEFPDWESKKLGEIAACLDSKRKPINSGDREKMKGVFPYYGSTSVQGYINDYIFDEEIVLLAEDAGPFHEYRVKPIAQYINEKCWVNNHAHVLRAKESAEFLFYSLVHKDIRGFVSSGQRAKLNQSSMIEIPLSLPSLSEQTKIAGFLSAVDEKIEKQSELVELLELQKKGYAQKLFNGSLRFKKADGTDYDDWESKKLGEVAHLKNGYSFKSSEYEREGKGKYKVITIKNVTGEKFVNEQNISYINKIPSNISEHQKLSIGDILISMTGNVGRVSLVNSNNLLLNQRVGLLETFDSKASKSYIYSIVASSMFEEYLIASSQGGAQKNTSNKEILDYSFSLPSIPEQEKIAGLLFSLDERIANEREKLAQLKEEKTAYLQRALV